MTHIRKALALVAVLWTVPFSLPVTASEKPEPLLTVSYPDIQHPNYSARDRYFHAMLKLVMAHSGANYQLNGIKLVEYSEGRSLQFILDGRYDVHWLNTTREREEALLPVRIPLYKGAIGWRAFLIRPDRQAGFRRIRTMEQLQRVVFGQGHDWPDVDILLQNGFMVERSPSWSGLFRMVLLDRIQAFPRSIVEITAEQQQPEARGLIVEDSLILQYPAAYYFFVAKDNVPLARALETGLLRTIENGSFDKLFYQYFGEAIQSLGIEKRTIISIPNPVLQAQMPLDRPELWFDAKTFAESTSAK